MQILFKMNCPKVKQNEFQSACADSVGDELSQCETERGPERPVQILFKMNCPKVKQSEAQSACADSVEDRALCL